MSYSLVGYIYESFSGLITSVERERERERANFSAVDCP